MFRAGAEWESFTHSANIDLSREGATVLGSDFVVRRLLFANVTIPRSPLIQCDKCPDLRSRGYCVSSEKVPGSSRKAEFIKG